MLELLAECEDGVIAAAHGGVLTKGDYQGVLVPHLEKRLRPPIEGRVLFPGE
jgi:hypothetical protein